MRRAAAIAPFLIAGVAALAAPLAHQDLPSHLRMGEWILDHRAVPFVEPVAWTRPGEPYFAYSWLAQLLFAAAWRLAGAFGLHVVHAAITVAAGLAIVAFARAEEWTSERTSIVVALHLAALAVTVPSLRPQMILFIAVPLVAAGVSRLVRHGMHAKGVLIVIAGSALAANTHLFFPLTLTPLAWAYVNGVPKRRLALFAGPIFAGWLLSPYALSWVNVYRLNFAPNAMLARGSPIAEIAPGFSEFNLGALLVLGFAVFMAMHAWLSPAEVLTSVTSGVPPARARRRLRIVVPTLFVVVWVAYAAAVRLAMVDWLILLAFVSAGAGALLRHGRTELRTVALAAVIVAAVWPTRWIHWRDAGLGAPGIAAPLDRALGPLALHVRCTGRPLDDARVFARFAEGSYLSWALSPARISVDTRTIFPDSVARPERQVMLGGDVSNLGPWRDGQLVILRASDPAASAIEADASWESIGQVAPLLLPSSARMSVTWNAWARKDWLGASARVPHASMPARSVDPRREPCPEARLVATRTRGVQPR